MTQPRILIESHHGKELGAQIWAFLQGRDCYQVDIIEGPLADRKKVGDPRPDLIIPVLPACTVTAGQLLATPRKGEAHTPLLPVLRAADLAGMRDALFRWAADFLVTPLTEVEVLARVHRLLGSREQERTTIKSSTTEALGLAQLVGEDPALVAVKRLLPLVARRDAPVLLTGETGTGKELCARALHYLSPRARRPFLPVNCGAIPVELFERELFGHHKGAFTGAGSAQPGFVAEAEGGTLFLDEIECLGLGAQAKLLRFVEDQSYHALGNARTKRADVRILAATNVELSGKVQDRTFREDLFYRLAVLNLTLPPLRERRGDIPLLAAHLWSRYTDRDGQPERRLSVAAIGALCAYPWPGNVRELENVLQQVLLLTDARDHRARASPDPAIPLAGETQRRLLEAEQSPGHRAL